MSNRLTKGKGLFGALETSGDVTIGGAAHIGGTLGVVGAVGITGALTAASIGLGGATLKDVTFGTLSVVHGTILPGGIGTVAQAFAGLAAADIVAANVLTPTADLIFGGVKPAAGTISTYLTNPTAGTVSPGTFTLTYAHFDLT